MKEAQIDGAKINLDGGLKPNRCSRIVLIMDIESAHRIADIILHAPTVTRLGLAAPDRRLRECAAERLGELVATKLADPPVCDDERQMSLPIAL